MSKWRVRGLGLISLLALGALSTTRPSRACGGLYLPEKHYRPGPQELVAAKIPWTKDEHALVIHEESSATEHLVREIRFEKSDPRHELVVPVPARPTVTRLPTSPFAAIGNAFPADDEETKGAYGKGTISSSDAATAISRGASEGAISAERFGRLAAYVLPPRSAAATDRWLDEHGFSPDTARLDWMERYADLGFHYVAFRYEPTPADTWEGGDAIETVDISFATKTPFFPYREPQSDGSLRRLTVWTVSDRPLVPIAPINEEVVRRPFVTMGTQFVSAPRLSRALGDLARFATREGAFVSTLRDHKLSRGTFGDVLFVPATPLGHLVNDERSEILDVDWVEGQAMALAILDPRSAPIASVGANDAGAERIARVRIAGAAFLGAGLLLGLATLGVARRRRLLGLALVPAAAIAMMGPLSCNNGDLRQVAWSEVPGVLAERLESPSEAPDQNLSLFSSAKFPRTMRARTHLRLLDGDLEAEKLPEEGGTPPKLVKLTWAPLPFGGVRMTEVGASVGPQLPAAVVRRLVRAHFPRLRACYQAGLARDPALHGTITVRFTIGSRGDVESASFGDPESTDSAERRLDDATTSACVVSVFRTISFPEPEGGNVSVRYPLRFENGDA